MSLHVESTRFRRWMRPLYVATVNSNSTTGNTKAIRTSPDNFLPASDQPAISSVQPPARSIWVGVSWSSANPHAMRATVTEMRGLSRQVTVGVAAFLLSACGASSPSSTASSQTTPSSSPSNSAATKLAANADACAMVTSEDATALLGELAPGPAPTAAPVPGGPPSMLSGSSCFYHGVRTVNDAGLVQALLGRFSDASAAHVALQQLVTVTFSGAPTQPVSGVGDEAIEVNQTLPTPYTSGRFVVIAVRKGAAAFIITAGVLTGHGPADVHGAVLALAQKVASRL
jgi:hypothetical protein